MEWQDIAWAAFKYSMGFAFLHGVRELGFLRKSIDRLNISMAVVVEKVQSHDKRIRNLERKQK